MTGALLNTNDPFFNLALEDYLLHKGEEESCFIYTNNPSVMVGRHQVIYLETNVFEAYNLDIPVIRRISGGGTVYHDRGNLNFSFIRNSEAGMQVDFAFYTKPIIEFLNQYGIPAVFSGKSDITVEGFKISGNAEHVYRERVLHHGTLLFNTSLETMKRLIRERSVFYNTKAVESNRSNVINLKGKIKGIESIDKLAEKLFEFMVDYFKITGTFELTGEAIAEITSLSDSKYRTWEWNYGLSPAYEFNSSFEWDGIPHSVNMYVRDGIIWKCNIEGSNEMSVAGKELIGCRHMYEDIKKILCGKFANIDNSIIIRFF